jgi:hypothetical protein
MLNVVHTYYVKESVEPVLSSFGYPKVEWPNGIKKDDYTGLDFILGPDKNNKEIFKHRYFGNFFSYGFNNGLIKYFSVENLPEGKYIFPIHIFDTSFYVKYSQEPLYIPSQIVNDLQNGKAKIMFITDDEQQEDLVLLKSKMFKRQTDYYHFNSKNIIYLSSNYFVEKELRNENVVSIYYNHWQFNIPRLIQAAKVVEENKNNILTKQIKEKKFLCFNRTTRPHRSNLVNRLLKLGLNKNSIVTYAGVNSTPGSFFPYKELDGKMPLTYDMSDTTSIIPGQSFININTEAHSKCYFNVVTESFFNTPNNMLYYNEKTFKPIQCLQPFILVGQCFGLKNLKEMGYQTFHPFINESYDEKITSQDRMNAILNEIERLYNMTNEQLSDMLYELYPILLHNYNQHMFLTQSYHDGSAIIDKINKSW